MDKFDIERWESSMKEYDKVRFLTNKFSNDGIIQGVAFNNIIGTKHQPNISMNNQYKTNL